MAVLRSADGLPSDDIKAVIADNRSGHEVAGSGQPPAPRWDGASWQTFTTADGLADNSVHDIALDPRNGDLWLVPGPGSTHKGITRFDGSRGQAITTADGLAANNAWSVVVDASGLVAVASSDDNGAPGFSLYDGQAWHVYTTADGLIDDNVFDVAIDHQGTLWIATLAGLSEFHPAGLPPPGPTPEEHCVCRQIRARVPASAITATLADPASISGWRQPLDPGKPVGPYNPLRECLTLQRLAVPFHPLFNPLQWHAGCP